MKKVGVDQRSGMYRIFPGWRPICGQPPIRTRTPPHKS